MRITNPISSGRALPFGILASRDFRHYWLGYIVSVSGQQMLWLAQGWLIYELSGSKLLLGANGLVQAIPGTVLTLFGGVVADKVDQRRLLIVIQLLQMVFLGVLAMLSFMQVVQVWHILATTFALAAIGAFENPARQAMFPHLVDRHALTNAVALNATVHPGTKILGPTVAGVILAQVVDATSSAKVAAGALFSVTALGFAVYAIFLKLVRLPPVHRSRSGTVFQDMADGLHIIWKNRVFSFLIGMTYFNMFFSLSMSVLFPVIAKDILKVGPSALGFMYTAMGIGSLLGAAVTGILSNAVGRGWVLVVGSAVLGTFLILFALSTWYPLALLFLWLTGIGSSLYSVVAQSTLQLMVPSQFRGRVMGVWGMTHTGVRPLGEMQLGGVATLVSAPFALVLGGALVVAFALLVAAPNRHIRELSVSLAPT